MPSSKTQSKSASARLTAGGKRQALGRGLENFFPALPNVAKPALMGIDLITPNPQQPRRVFDKDLLGELAHSIRKNGLIQPVVVKKAGMKYEIIAGERRWRACAMAGLHEIPVRVLDHSNPFLPLVENLQRADLNPIELAEALKHLMQSQNQTQEQLAKQLGIARATLANQLRLLNLSAPVRDLLLKGQLSFAIGKILLQEKDPSTQLKWAKHFAKNKTGVRKAIRLLSAQKKPTQVAPPAPPGWQTEALHRLQEQNGIKASLQTRKKGGELRIRFFSSEELKKLMSLLLESTE